MEDISREDLERLASSGNGWAQQELIRRFGSSHDAILKHRVENLVKKDDYGDIIDDKKSGEPTDKALYDRVIAAAKQKFDVYPSAVANGWVVQEYKRRGGTYAVQKSHTDNEMLYEAYKAKPNVDVLNATDLSGMNVVDMQTIDQDDMQKYLQEVVLRGGDAAVRAAALLAKANNEVAEDENHESMDDILRHDKGHDDWHASHGDPPCKDEADCARMRAKYDDEKSLHADVTKYNDDMNGHDLTSRK